MSDTVDGLTVEVARGFGQMEQRFVRSERRFDAMDAGLAEMRGELAASTDRIIAAMRGEP